LRQFRYNLNQIFAALALTSALLFQNATAFADTRNEPACPSSSLADQINAAMTPITVAVSKVVFFPIPILPGEETSTAAFKSSAKTAQDGDTFKLRIGDVEVFLEADANGVTCSDGKPVDPSLFDPKQLQRYLSDTMPPSLSTTLKEDGLSFSVTKGTAATLTVTGNTISGSDFDNGAVGLPIIVVWLLVGATFFTLRMGFVNVHQFFHAFSVAKGTYDNPDDPGEVTHFQALSAALSGTVGLGNIAGVALAISVGGAGATFWMILAGLLGMSSKFVECTLGVHYRKIGANGVVSGGPMYYLTQGLAEEGKATLGKILAIIFALLCIGGAFGAGGLFQVNQSTAQVMNTLTPLTGGEASILAGKPWIIGSIYAFLVGFVIIGGIKSITRVTEKLVPLMAFTYLSGALVVIGMNIGEIPSAVIEIIAGAFSPEGVAGGFVGVLVQGLRRASFSNEAGVGSAAIAHSAVKTTEPVSEGVVALLEPFIDTVVICTITALVIILTDRHLLGTGMGGIGLTSSAFESAISWFPYVLSIAVTLFAFSTSLTWFYYGQRAFLFLIGEKPAADLAFKLVYLVALVIGSSMTLGAVMDFADAMLLAMAFPNMIGLYILAPKVKIMLDSYVKRVKSGEISPSSARIVS